MKKGGFLRFHCAELCFTVVDVVSRAPYLELENKPPFKLICGDKVSIIYLHAISAQAVVYIEALT